MYTNRDLKKKAIEVLYNNYGFAPSMLKDIVLIAADNEEGQFIKFQVGKFIYLWDSYTLSQSVEGDVVAEDTEDPLDKYEDTVTGEKVIVLGVDDKYKTVMLERSNRKTVCMALSTFNRRYKLITN